MKILEKLRAASKQAAAARGELQVAVEEIRNELSRLRQERGAVDGAPITREETAQAIKRHLDELQAEAMARLSPGGFRRVPSRGEFAASADDAFRVRTSPVTSMVELVGGLCLLGLRSQIEANMLDLEMAAIPGDGLSDSERAAKLRKIDADIDVAERAEEFLIRNAEDAGIAVHRRHDARPEIYLAEAV
ncbi:hypothetical protein [Rhizobium leguminosarum]|uniref:Uncharacterized protein n=1 Tax=Rhizobium leguminosarum bv. viciae TaxID=387 RepID=A0A8G2MSE6_RHILV|nr:hypothetical protein [Rhizobium leguminosarum]MBY5619965.1 hypothetical protein [Rhizobium leguminosarum]NKK18617.1 hypothetical protein [Rhizobium leguminosarum bv. viciae]TBX98096.1 hypothetical protein E0H31_04095 [Rhizobium leguminosarum bv. viciae]TBZ09438.1 hypothetical protein E0H33_25450 [Rhizobium leguminosarum bv. viciae]TBZ10932.1 hypothetical protein E0H52_32540 [Rhizobium leguminosarum bv. viciae]